MTLYISVCVCDWLVFTQYGSVLGYIYIFLVYAHACTNIPLNLKRYNECVLALN